jgi:Kae1-associated kinase Bud32
MEEIIQRGAEAVIVKSGDSVIKRRVKKGYRLEEMDKRIRKNRTKREGRILEKVSKIISVPKIFNVDDREMEIRMEYLDGLKLSESLDDIEEWESVCKKIGENIGKLHDESVIHGDLTTSNMILVNDEVYFIDFGLGFGNGRTEDKAVDLHLIRQALEAKHFERWEEYWGEILKEYEGCAGSEKVLKQLEKVERRGRYKSQY